MKLGIAISPADFAIRPDELARAVEERGFESLFFTDHTHIPATPQTRKLMEDAQGGVLPHFTHNYDPLVALTPAPTSPRHSGPIVSITRSAGPIGRTIRS
jgi:alkanesulfonate monooxygenase SsuD/methylene tetrahydromethanopterin reductase-like flavin-dependent oxidoreductase (luciferase family)